MPPGVDQENVLPAGGALPQPRRCNESVATYCAAPEDLITGPGSQIACNRLELRQDRVELADVIRQSVETDAQGETERASPPRAMPPLRRVLVVDDCRDAAEALALLLRLAGFDSAMAHDGPEALDLAESMRPDVILLDIGLPSLDGYEVARRLRAQKWIRPPVIVALTGWGQDEDRARAFEAGFDGHLVKPVRLEMLLALLERLAPGDSPPD